MVERQWRGVYVGLAVASALLVVASSGVAVARLGPHRSDRHRQVAMASPTTPSHQAAPAATVTDSGPESGEPAHPVPPAPIARQRHPRPAWAASTASPTGMGTSAGTAVAVNHLLAPASSAVSTAPPAGLATDATPAPVGKSAPPTAQPLVAASVSAGTGATGGVAGVGVDDHQPTVDVTIGTTPLVGHAPPAHGTEIALGGQLLHPPPTIPVLPASTST